MTRYKNFEPMVREMMLASCFSGARLVKLMGRNSTISNAAETVWEPGATYAQLTAHAAMEVVSSSANDAAAGTGARTVRVDYLTANYVEASETVTLNGTTPVAMAATSIIAINAITVLTVGSGLTNAGNIDVRTVSGSVVKRRIGSAAQALGRSKDFLFTIPEDHIGILSSIAFSATGVTGDLTVWLNSYNSSGLKVCEGVGKSSLYVTGFNGAIGEVNLQSGLFLPERTLIELQAIVSAGAGDLVASAELFLVKKIPELGFPLT